MNTNTMAIEAEMKTQSFLEQAEQARRVRLTQKHNSRPFYVKVVRFSLACQAGWTAYRNSIQTTWQNTI